MHGVELAVCDHLRERLLRTDAPHLEFRRQIERDLFFAAGLFLASGPVLAARGVDAVLVLQDSANPYGRGHLVLRHADSLACELLRLADAALRGDENARVPEKARWKNGDGDEGGVLTHERHAIRGQRHLRRVELAVAQHPEKRLLDEEFVIDEVDALRVHAAVGERASAVVVPAGEGELESGHGISYLLLAKEGWRGAPGWFDKPGSTTPPAARAPLLSEEGNFPSLHRHRIGVERRKEAVLRAFLVVLSDRQLDRAGAHALRNRIESGHALAFARRLGRPKQAASRPDDSLVGHAQMLPGAVLDRAHLLLHRRILHRNTFHAAIGAAALLRGAVDKIVVRLVRERNEGARHVLHVDPRAFLHRLQLRGAERAVRMIVDAPGPAVLVVDRHPGVRPEGMSRPGWNDGEPRHDPRRDAPV